MTPEAAKQLATTWALRGVGKVAPNPLVGAVLVDREHRFLAAGAHELVGSHHAEINAFEAFAKLAERRPDLTLLGGTLYVTLEPCAHASRTPACAPRVATSGVARVVYGALDPNPAVNGLGAAILSAAGVKVQHDLEWQDECERLAEIFLWNIRNRSPFIALKAATSLDGFIARRGDRRAWITGDRARAYGHFLRTYYDAIVIGQQTLIADDPLLDTRQALNPGRTPFRVALDPDGAALRSRPNATWRMIQREPERTLWVVGPAVDKSTLAPLQEHGVQTLTLPIDEQGLFSPTVLATALGERGVTSLLLEGGAGLYGSFLKAGLVHKVHVFQAPRLMGATDALSWTATAGPLTVAADSAIEITPLGDDWVIEGALAPG